MTPSDPNENVATWYKTNYPQDTWAANKLNTNITFSYLWHYIKQGVDFYQIVGGDSIVRERIFEEISNRLNVPYSTVYNEWHTYNLKPEEYLPSTAH